MFELIQNMLGGKSDFQKAMQNKERGPMAIGKERAIDCYQNGLKTGEIVKLNSDFLHQNGSMS